MVQLWRAFGDLVPLFLLVVLAVSIITYFVSNKRNLDMKRVIINVLFVLSVIGILLVTVYPQYYGTEIPRIINLVPFIGMYEIMFHSVDISVPIRNLGLNILLFAPFGFFLSLKISSQKKLMLTVVLTGFSLSLVIELVQYIFPMGRSADIDDLILNTIGTFLGFVTFKLLRTRFPSVLLSKGTTRSSIQ